MKKDTIEKKENNRKKIYVSYIVNIVYVLTIQFSYNVVKVLFTMPKLTYRMFNKTKREKKSSSFLLQFYIISLHFTLLQL